MFVLTCENCKHCENNSCEYDLTLDECEDAYDCSKFEDSGDGIVT